MQHVSFAIKGDTIQLFKLLKVMGIADSGKDAKQMVDDGLITINNQKESRKRAQLHPGDKVQTSSHTITVLPTNF